MSDAAGVQEWHVGKHILRYEPPDVLVTVFVGDVSGADMAELSNLNRQKTSELKTWFALLDMGKLGAFSAEAKQLIRQAPLSNGNAAFGASTQMRLIVSMFAKIYSMIYRGAETPIFFAADEAAARAWLDSRRRAIAEQKK